MITCTGLEEFVGDRKRFNHIFHVVNGMVSNEEENPLSAEAGGHFPSENEED